MAEASEESEPGKAALVPKAAKSKAKPKSPSPNKMKNCFVKAEPNSAQKLAKAKLRLKPKVCQHQKVARMFG